MSTDYHEVVVGDGFVELPLPPATWFERRLVQPYNRTISLQILSEMSSEGLVFGTMGEEYASVRYHLLSPLCITSRVSRGAERRWLHAIVRLYSFLRPAS